MADLLLPQRRSSSSSTGHRHPHHPLQPPPPAAATAAAAKATATASSSSTASTTPLSDDSPPPLLLSSAVVAAAAAAAAAPVHPTLLQPRVAVVLNVPPPWHPWLFTLRLVSVLPAAWWGLPSLLQLLVRWLPGPEMVAAGVLAGDDSAAQMYAVTETGLATIWCFASGYLSFFFTDCLMSRWLIYYTPHATMVRLLTINVCNAYLTAGVLSLSGGFRDPRLLLPGWIGIATTLTVMYHITHQKINIRKETSTSINVFSIASFLSMVALLAHLHVFTPNYPQIPLVLSARRAWDEASRVAAQVAAQANAEREL